MVELRDRIEGSLVGLLVVLLVGDALGVPYEFRAPGGFPRVEEIEFDLPRICSTAPTSRCDQDMVRSWRPGVVLRRIAVGGGVYQRRRPGVAVPLVA